MRILYFTPVDFVCSNLGESSVNETENTFGPARCFEAGIDTFKFFNSFA